MRQINSVRAGFLVEKQKKKKKQKTATTVWNNSLAPSPLLLPQKTDLKHIFSICFSRAPFPSSLSDLLSPPASLCFISSRTARLCASAHSNEQGKEASVLITMPAASNLICQTVPFSKFNLERDTDDNPMTVASSQATVKDWASKRERKLRKPMASKKTEFVGKWKVCIYVCINRKWNTLVFSFLASSLHRAVAHMMKLTEIDLNFTEWVSGRTELEIII